MATNGETETFFNSAAQLPVVQSATDTASAWYTWAKDSNQYVNSGLTLLEQQASNVVEVVSNNDQLAPHLTALDSAATAGLNTLVTKYPVLSSPTEKIIADSRDAVQALAGPATTMITVAQQAVNEKAIAAQAAFHTAEKGAEEAVTALQEYSLAITQKISVGDLEAHSLKVKEAINRAQEHVTQSVEASQAYATAYYDMAKDKYALQSAAVKDTSATYAHEGVCKVNQYTEPYLNVRLPQTQDELTEALAVLTAKMADMQVQVSQCVTTLSDRSYLAAQLQAYERTSTHNLSESFTILSARITKNFDDQLSSIKKFMEPLTGTVLVAQPAE